LPPPMNPILPTDFMKQPSFQLFLAFKAPS